MKVFVLHNVWKPVVSATYRLIFDFFSLLPFFFKFKNALQHEQSTEIHPLIFSAQTHASYLHKTVSGVGVEVKRRVFFNSFGEGGMRGHHSSLNIGPWWSQIGKQINLHTCSIIKVHFTSWYLVSRHRSVCWETCLCEAALVRLQKPQRSTRHYSWQ